jgi:hypothetical protein
VSVTVDCPPTAVADSATVAQGAAAVISVLANDADPDGGLKAVASATPPAHGTISVSPMGVVYRSAADYCGADSFNYTLNGGSTATVSVTVTCLQRPDTSAPNTGIAKKPAKAARKRLAKFRFTSTEGGSKFACKLDKRRWRSCSRVFEVKVRPGKHVIRVRATDKAGNRDRTPAVYRWKVLRHR